MTADQAEPPGRTSFNDASPREVRAALVPEEQPDFDQQWHKALADAGESLEIADLLRVLDSWRRRAMITTHLGHDGYRRMLAKADHILRTGEPMPGSVPWSQLKVELGL